MRPRLELLLAALLTACAHPAAAPANAPSTAPAVTATATPLPLHITSSGGTGQYTTLSEMKHQRTIYIIRATSFAADTQTSRTSPSSTATARAPSPMRRRPT
jgi:hypothetical protein